MARRLKYFIREYIKDLVTGLGTLVIAVIIPYFITDPRVIAPLTTSAILIGMFVIIIIRTRHRDFFFISFARHKQGYDWIGRGSFKFNRNNKCFEITNADPGYIYINCLNWSNYKLSCEFRVNTFNSGIIVRARDLSNYIMLQFREDDIQPHIRINQLWVGLEHIPALTYQDAKKIELGRWYSCILTCDNDTIDIILNDGSNNYLSKSWSIPNLQNFNIPLYQLDKETNKEQEIGFVHFPLNLEYGSVGFRSWDKENTFIRNLLVEKI